MTESKNLNGVVVTSIPFTHPNHVPQILVLLKQQAVFNSLVSSVVRQTEKQGKLLPIRNWEMKSVRSKTQGGHRVEELQSWRQIWPINKETGGLPTTFS